MPRINLIKINLYCSDSAIILQPEESTSEQVPGSQPLTKVVVPEAGEGIESVLCTLYRLLYNFRVLLED